MFCAKCGAKVLLFPHSHNVLYDFFLRCTDSECLISMHFAQPNLVLKRKGKTTSLPRKIFFPPEEKLRGCFLPLGCRLRVKHKKQDAYVIFSEKDFAISQKMC